MKPSVLISVALLSGALAVFLIARWVGVGGAVRRGPPVVVALVPIEAGEPLTSAQLQVLSWPSSATPDGTFVTSDAVVGRVTRQALVAGEPVLESRLVPVDGRAGLSAVLSPGKRAITVRVNDVIGVAGFALPGTYVDVLVSARDANNEPFSRIVLERVRVLAVAQDTVSAPSKPKVVNAVTLELTPHESERLDLARSVGSLSLALRNEFDKTSPVSVGTRLDALMGTVSVGPAVSAVAAVPAAAPVRAPSSVSRQRTRASAPSRETRERTVQEFRGTQRGGDQPLESSP